MRELTISAIGLFLFGCAPVAQDTGTTANAQQFQPGPQASEPSQALPQASAGAIQFQPDRGNPMRVPKGWTVKTMKHGNVDMLRIDETPGSPRSPMLSMVMQEVSTGATPENLLRRVSGSVNVARVLEVRTFANGGGFLLVAGTVGNIPAKMAAISTGDGTRVYAAFFVAPTARFDALGGTRVLLSSLRMNRLPPAAPRKRQPTTSSKVDVFSYKGQLRMLANRQRVAPATIVGTWSQGVGVPMGSVYTNVTNGTISYDSLGHGNMLEFRADGRYAWIHNYAQQYRSCRNTVTASETGTYRFDGMTLILTPTKVDANLCACCTRPTKMTRTVHKPRTYEVAVAPGKNHFVLRGTCPAYMISCVGDAPKYMREGFARGK